MDLTGKVRKTQAYYFTNGELADVIWIGEWSRRNLYNPLHFFLSIQPEQRLGFSDGGEGYPRRWQQCGPFRATRYIIIRNCYERQKLGANRIISTSRPSMSSALI